MNKEKKKFFILSSILFLLILIFLNNKEVKNNIIMGTSLWASQVFPSLFPMFILSDLLIHYHFPEYLSNILGRYFSGLFHTSSYGIFVLIMSFLSGTPSSAFILKDLVNQNKLTNEEASYLLSFTFFSNPLFLLNMLSLIFPNNSISILKVMLIHYFSNLIIAFLLRPKNKTYFTKIKIPKKENPFGTLLGTSIKKAMDTLLLILGTICFYFIIATLMPSINPLQNTITSAFLELTQGLNKLVTINLSLFWKEILAVSFISFGGLSIHTQIQSILSDTFISYKPFLKGRILHVIISCILITII